MIKKWKKTRGKLQFSIFWKIFAPLEAKMMKNDKNLIKKMIKNEKMKKNEENCNFPFFGKLLHHWKKKWWKMIKQWKTHDKKMKKLEENCNFSFFWDNFCTIGSKNDEKWKNDKNVKNDKNMIKMIPEMINKNEDDKINDKKMMNAMITKMIKKWKKLFWPGPVCGCKFFIIVSNGGFSTSMFVYQRVNGNVKNNYRKAPEHMSYHELIGGAHRGWQWMTHSAAGLPTRPYITL